MGGVGKAVSSIFGGGGGGGGGNITYNVPQPAAPQPIDYEKMYSAAQRYGKIMLGDQVQATLGLYPQMTALQFGTADDMARRLDNSYFQRARGVISDELNAASAPNQIEAELQRRALGDLTAGPTVIQRQLRDDAQRDLALGQSLSPEEQRNAAQSARAAFAARGLGTSAGSSAAEILNRDTFGRQRQDQRRQFAMGADQFFTGAEEARRAQALGANQLDLARRQRRIGLAGAYGDMDPYRQGLNAAFNMGGANLDRSIGMASGAFNNSLATAGNVETFNRNMQASQFNSWMNNNAAVQAANAQAGAMRQSGTMGLLGSLGGGLLSGAGMALAFSDKRMKKDIKPLGKAGSVLGLTAYEFSYKGEDKKHKGFMAQDVAKVLPEAVAEVDYRGKKRLAIKPAVIGAALAEELMAAKAA
jgi:hypothetical protein